MSFWSGRRVFVTGGSGLVGSWLVCALVDAGSAVAVLIRDIVPRSYLTLSGYAERVTAVHGELEDFETVRRTLVDYEIDTIFHLAAQTIVGAANRLPIDAFRSNIMGTAHVLEAARVHDDLVKRVVVASSDKAYGDSNVLPYTEDMPLAGRHPYDVSKSCADLIATAYYQTYGVPLAIARCGNIFGGGDLNFSRIVPGTIRSALSNEAPVVRSDGTPVRDYVYVTDAVLAYLALAENISRDDVAGEAFNFSEEQPLSVLEVVERVLALTGREDLAPVVLGTATNEIAAQHLSAAKARRVLGWKPETGMDAGLEQTIAWYQSWLAGT